MPPPESTTDEHGFPIPKDFDGRDARPQPRRPRTPPSQKARRWAAVLIALLMLGAATFPLLKEAGTAIWARWHQQRSEQRYHSDDLPGALEDIETAISLRSDDAVSYYLRSQYRLDDYTRADHAQMSLDDINRAIELEPRQPLFYEFRSRVLQRLGRYREAIEEIDRAIDLAPPATAMQLNNRAYVRALGKIDLKEALDDVQESIRLDGGRSAASLDTRGYLFYLLEQYEPALDDMNKTIVLAERHRQATILGWEDSPVEAGERTFLLRPLDQALAVFYHHRGLIHEKLGNPQQAKADLAHGDKLGYDPEKGVW